MDKNVHILLKYASTYEVPDISLEPKGCHYDQTVGAWVVDKTREIYITTPEGPKPQTKKCDIETGEDQKKE